MVSYNRQTIDSPNPLARLAHRARTETAIEGAAAAAAPDSKVLDYGCGPGVFLHQLGLRRPDLTLVGYDPFYDGEMEPGVTLVDDLTKIDDSSISVFTAFETCEHLDDAELDVFLGHARRTLVPGGVLLLSVPIVAGPGVLAKELNRMVLHRRRSDYTVRELAAVVVAGRPAARDDIKTSHKGFDFRQLRTAVARQFTLQRQWNSPFLRAPWPVNSQHFSSWTSTPQHGSSQPDQRPPGNG